MFCLYISANKEIFRPLLFLAGSPFCRRIYHLWSLVGQCYFRRECSQGLPDTPWPKIEFKIVMSRQFFTLSMFVCHATTMLIVFMSHVRYSPNKYSRLMTEMQTWSRLKSEVQRSNVGGWLGDFLPRCEPLTCEHAITSVAQLLSVIICT